MSLNLSRRLMVASALAAWPWAAVGAASGAREQVAAGDGEDCACGCAAGAWVPVLPGVGGVGCRRALNAA